MMTTLSSQEIHSILHQECRDPFQILGPHLVDVDGKQTISIRCFLPLAVKASVKSLDQGEIYTLEKIHPGGIFEKICSGREKKFPYEIHIEREDGSLTSFRDSYSFPPGLTNFDLYLIEQGHHYRTFDKLGAHAMEIDGVQGTYFALWAPSAKSVSIIGSFNWWDRRFHIMRTLGNSGVFELFVPGIGEGERYKFQITTWNDFVFDKTDPHGFYSEISPQTASIVYNIENYAWKDEEWIKSRPEKQKNNAPISIYEVHLGSWIRDPERPTEFLKYGELASKLVEYVKQMGYTHVELLPVQEHPFYGSWGYQSLGLYAPTSRYGEPRDFMYFVDTLHQNGIGVILDWVPAHFPKDAHGLAYFDGTFLYEHADPRKREQKDWNTHIYNFGRPEVKNFLISNGLFWLEKYHLDGLRVDAVTSILYLDYCKNPGEWIPNKYGGRENLEAIEFLREFNRLVEEKHPGTITIAEEATSWPGVSRPVHLGGLGFSYKWNMGWMNDILRYMSLNPIFRKFYHHVLSFSIWYSFNENFILPLSHDEVVHLKKSMVSKMPGDLWKKFANLRLLYGFMFSHPGKKLLFMGGDFGQWHEWNHDQSLDWHLLRSAPHQGLHQYVRDLNFFYRSNPCLFEFDATSDGFEWADFRDADHSIISYWRKGKKEKILFVMNFTPVPRLGYRIGVNDPGRYQEVFNSDSEVYYGSNVINPGEIRAWEVPCHNKPYHLSLNVPPLGMMALKPLDLPEKKEPVDFFEKKDESVDLLEKRDEPGKEGKK